MSNITTQEYSLLKKQVANIPIAHLNDMQKEAVHTVKGPLLILAGAGSGKTTVIIQRVAHIMCFGEMLASDEIPLMTDDETELIRNCAKTGEGIAHTARIMAVRPPKPWNILAITFTNKAAGELRERLTATLGEDAKDIAAATFHSICVRILRAEIEKLGYGKNFTIYDTDDSLRVIKESMSELNYDEKSYAPRMLLSLISRAKDHMLSPKDLVEDDSEYMNQVTGKVYERYQKKLKDANAVDFDDIIILAVQVLSENPDTLAKYQNRWKYIMVDEYQDTNMTQYRLVHLLAKSHNNICVVGDDDQSIYKFRGATIENILQFEEQFEDTKVIRLEQNYRSTSSILDAANAVIANNRRRKGKTLWTSNDGGELVTHYNAQDEQREAAYVANEIERSVKDGGRYNDNAVLYRVNSQSQSMEQMFIRRGIPYKIIGGRKFFDRKEVKDVLAYLQVVNNFADDLRLKRIINEPKRGIGAATIGMVAEIAQTLGMSMFEVLLNADDYAPLGKKSPPLKAFALMISDIAREAEDCTLIDTLNAVLDRSGYKTALIAKADDESRTRLENIKELETTVQKYMDETENPTLAGFLEEIALYTDLDSLDDSADYVIMMTLHAAKGLEFGQVFIVGMEENIFPGTRSIATPAEIEEERRLAYVGITRAKKQLHILTATQRMFQGRTSRNRPSRFLREIPSDLLNRKDENGRSSFATTSQASSFASPIPRSASAMPTEKQVFDITVGERVRHYKFGDGKVLSITPMGGDNLVEIAFDSGSTKRLMASFIKLERI